MVVDRTDYNDDVARFMHAFLSLPYEIRGKHDSAGNLVHEADLTFNQLLGRALLNSLDSDHANNMVANLFPAPDGTYDSKAQDDALEALLPKPDPILKDQYKYEAKTDGILRYLKQYGYKFRADSMIEIGVETRRLDDLLRQVDQTGLEAEQLAPLKASPPKERMEYRSYGLGEDVTYEKDKHHHYLIHSNDQRKLCVQYSFISNDFYLSTADEAHCKKIAAAVEKLQTTPDAKPISVEYEPVENEYYFHVQKTDANTRPFFQLLVKEKIISQAQSHIFQNAIKEFSIDKGLEK